MRLAAPPICRNFTSESGEVIWALRSATVSIASSGKPARYSAFK
jgi:hypothetical protein